MGNNTPLLILIFCKIGTFDLLHGFSLDELYNLKKGSQDFNSKIYGAMKFKIIVVFFIKHNPILRDNICI
jgi:hypothetical protein